MMNASNIHFEMAERGRALNYGGIGGIHLMGQRLGLAEEINDRLRLLKRHLPYHEGFPPRLSPEAVELLTVHTDDVAQIAVPPEDSAEHVVEFEERHVIGDRDQADDHRAHLAQNRSQNQAFEGECFSRLSRLPRTARPPTF
jgi:hypothetical protein